MCARGSFWVRVAHTGACEHAPTFARCGLLKPVRARTHPTFACRCLPRCVVGFARGIVVPAGISHVARVLAHANTLDVVSRVGMCRVGMCRVGMCCRAINLLAERSPNVRTWLLLGAGRSHRCVRARTLRLPDAGCSNRCTPACTLRLLAGACPAASLGSLVRSSFRLASAM